MVALAASGPELFVHVVRGHVLDLVAGEAGALAKRLRDMAFADTGGAEKQDIASAIDESAGRQIEDSRLGDLGIEVEVEILQRLLVFEVGAPDPLVEHLGFAALYFVGEQTK